MTSKRQKLVVISAILLVVSLLLGTLFFYWHEDYTLGQSMYTTVLITTTVGPSSEPVLSETGKAFVALYAILNVSLFLFFVAASTDVIFHRFLRSGPIQRPYWDWD